MRSLASQATGWVSGEQVTGYPWTILGWLAGRPAADSNKTEIGKRNHGNRQVVCREAITLCELGLLFAELCLRDEL